MKKFLWFRLVVFLPFFTNAQETITTIDEIELDKVQPNHIKKYWLKMIDNGMSQPVCIPVIIAKGKTTHPVLGLLAGIHGNELNGIRVINKVIETINLDSLQGTIIAIPGLNVISLLNHQR